MAKGKGSFKDAMEERVKKSAKLSRVGGLGGFWGRAIVFCIAFIIPIITSLIFSVIIIVVLAGGMVAIIESDEKLKVDYAKGNSSVVEDKGNEDLSNRVINIPEEMKGKMFFPIGPRISSNRQRNRCMPSGCRDHLGLDLAGGFTVANGPDVLPIYPGVVHIITHGSELGNHVVMKHTTENGESIYSSYGHMSKLYVKKGDVLGYNTKIGKTGGIGKGGVKRYAVHLHLEIHTSVRDTGHGSYASTLEPLDLLQCTENTKIIKRAKVPPEIDIRHCMEYRKSATAGMQ